MSGNRWEVFLVVTITGMMEKGVSENTAAFGGMLARLLTILQKRIVLSKLLMVTILRNTSKWEKYHEKIITMSQRKCWQRYLHMFSAFVTQIKSCYFPSREEAGKSYWKGPWGLLNRQRAQQRLDLGIKEKGTRLRFLNRGTILSYLCFRKRQTSILKTIKMWSDNKLILFKSLPWFCSRES